MRREDPGGGPIIKAGNMANLSLRNVKKIYPHSNDQKKAKKAKKGEAPAEEKKVNLQITERRVWSPFRSSTWRLPIRSSSCW